MYNVPVYVPKIRLIGHDGIVAEFKDLKDAAIHLNAWGMLYHRIGDEFYDTSISLYDIYGRSFDYVVRTEFGDSVTVEELRKALPRRKTGWYARYVEQREKARKNFRNGPVPGTGCRRYHGSYYRNPKTTSERRDAVDVLNDEEMKEYGIRPRAKRNFMNLPDAWDDVRCSRRGNNWKNYRKKQWKDKK